VPLTRGVPKQRFIVLKNQMNMKKYINKSLSLLALLSLLSCTRDENDNLTLRKRPYTGQEIQTNGFYYTIWDNNTSFGNVTFLYRDGTILKIGGSGKLSELDAFVAKSIPQKYAQWKAFWGVFHVNGNQITQEEYHGSQLGMLVYRSEGNIINNAQFAITETSRMKNGSKTDVRSVAGDPYRSYYFKACKQKPDSTNAHIQ
jgi:hypothetical protein